jgi:hypothetical protein
MCHRSTADHSFLIIHFKRKKRSRQTRCAEDVHCCSWNEKMNTPISEISEATLNEKNDVWPDESVFRSAMISSIDLRTLQAV